jgi:predicted DCC family thiol-disulfide oxidoreductase YuxK
LLVMPESARKALPLAAEHLLLYDGVCGLCNRMNQFVLPRDRAGVFVFASLQSRLGRSTLARFGQSSGDLNTFYVVKDYRADSPTLLSKSSAGLFVMRLLGSPWRWLGLFGVLPSGLLNLGYDLIASNRYRLFGRSDVCLLPSAEYKQRFLDI